jgi:hypothetical protein
MVVRKGKSHLLKPSMTFDHGDDLSPCEGPLEKLNSRGNFQMRYFVLKNHYLTYYKDERLSKLLAGIDLLEVLYVFVCLSRNACGSGR